MNAFRKYLVEFIGTFFLILTIGSTSTLNSSGVIPPLAIGGILGTNSDLILLLYSPATYDVADVIGTYTYRLGIEGGQYSYTAAAGLFMSVIGFALTYIANKVSDKLTGFGLW